MAKYLGVTTFDPSDRSNANVFPGLVDGDVDDIVAAINGALQELWEIAPAALRSKQIGALLYGPVAVSLQVTHASSQIVGFAGYQSWMQGCTIRISGDGMDNELVNGDTLLRPYLGVGGGVSATVFCDCTTPAENVLEIIEPVRTAAPLYRARSRAAFEFRGSTTQHALAKPAGTPWMYHVDASFQAQGMAVRLRVSPMPGAACTITYGAKLRAPAISRADIGAASDPGTVFPLPGGWEESVLLPLALQRFTAHPGFRSVAAKDEIQRQAEAARRIIIQAAEPQRAAETLIPTFR